MNYLDDTDQNDPKKILKEWVSSVRAHAYNGKGYLYRRNTKNETLSVKDLDHASDEFAPFTIPIMRESVLFGA